MQKQYHHYTAWEFAIDDLFLRWHLLSEEEDKLFWQNFMQEHPEQNEIIHAAIKILQSVKMNDYSLSENEKNLILENLNKSISKKNKKIKTFRIVLSIAASITLFIASSLFFFHHYPGTRSMDKISNIEPDSAIHSKNIRLILANNEEITFDEDAAIHYNNDDLIVYAKDREVASMKINKDKTKILLNKLIVPKGKRSELTLSDGTRIWINSGSTLEYPSEFDKMKREISINGEIYIEVSKNDNHPFFVNTSAFSVKVLGTRFNVSAYKEDSNQSIVLVEGSIEVENRKNKKIKMEPDQMLLIDNELFQTIKVNVYDYISWKDGLLQFRSETLSGILGKLSRHYDIKIDCQEIIKDMKCTGKLVLFDNFEDVIKTISNTIPVVFEKKENSYYVREKNRQDNN